ncbi:MAG: hypothetical protein SVW77_03575 [Candidatus Nanohaloarchaea archaeon]|nr:hypothetical protein [Candidatus Nanohaloarchaea archaeon]
MPLEDIFRAYDVRGAVPAELDEDVMRRIGAGFARRVRGDADRIVVGRDVRPSSPALQEALMQGVVAEDVSVIDAGLVPYGPVLFHARANGLPSAYITASHLEEGNNGVKFAHPDGTGYVQEENDAVRQAAPAQDPAGASRAEVEAGDILPAYRDHLLQGVQLEGMDVVVDPGNGAASVIAADVFWKAGASTECMHCDPDGTFPNRPSDVTAENLAAVREVVADGGQDLGVAYDGDADRLAVIDDTGRVLSAEETAAIVMQHILPEDGGPVVANVECSRLIEDVAQEYGVEVVRTRVGHSYLFREVLDRDAALGVEKSRHMAVPRVFPLDDAVAASLAVAEAVRHLDRPLSAAVDDLPSYYRDRISFETPPAHKFDIVEELAADLQGEYDDTDTIDGVRVDLDRGWVLIRASNTSPVIRLTVEAETDDDFAALQEEFGSRIEAAIEAAS